MLLEEDELEYDMKTKAKYCSEAGKKDKFDCVEIFSRNYARNTLNKNPIL